MENFNSIFISVKEVLVKNMHECVGAACGICSIISCMLWKGVSLGEIKGIHCKAGHFLCGLGALPWRRQALFNLVCLVVLEQVHHSSDFCKSVAASPWKPRFWLLGGSLLHQLYCTLMYFWLYLSEWELCWEVARYQQSWHTRVCLDGLEIRSRGRWAQL